MFFTQKSENTFKYHQNFSYLTMGLNHLVYYSFGHPVCFPNDKGGQLWEMFIGEEDPDQFMIYWNGEYDGTVEQYMRSYLIDMEYSPASLAEDLEIEPKDFGEAEDIVHLWETLISSLAYYAVNAEYNRYKR